MAADKKNDKWYFSSAATKISALAGASGERRALGRAVQLRLIADPKIDLFKDLAGDIFSALYHGATPTPGLPDLRRAANHAILRWLDADIESWHNARIKANGSTRIAAYVGGAVWAEVMKNPFYKELLDKQNQYNTAAEKGGSESDKAKALEQELLDMIGDLDQFLGPVAATQITQSAAADASDMHGLEKMAKSWGNEPGDTSDQEFEKYLKFMREHKGWIEAINQAIGRAYGNAATLGNRFDVEWGEIADVQPTRDLAAVFADEYVGLAATSPPPVRAYYVSRFNQNGLLGLHEKKSGTKQGSMILLIDYSGSMGASLNMNGEQTPAYIVAGGTAIGIIMAAREAGRKFYAITFSGGWQGDEIYAVDENSSWTDVLAWILNFSGGGTPLDAALNNAFDWLDAHGEDDMTLDIGAITDGIAKVEDETIARWEALKERFGTRLLDVGINNGGALENIRDAFVHVPTDDAGGSIDEVAKIIGEWISG